MAKTELSDQAKDAVIAALHENAAEVQVLDHGGNRLLTTQDPDVITAVFEHVEMPFD